MGKSVYGIVQERILELLDSGVGPWTQPWKGGSSRLPHNLKSKKAYRGSNIWMLLSAGYGSRWWVTYKQAQEQGWSVRKGEKSTPVTWWQFREYDANGKITKVKSKVVKRTSSLRLYRLFNIEQCIILETDEVPKDPDAEEGEESNDPIEAAEEIVTGYDGPAILSGPSCYYIPSEDKIHVPSINSFDPVEGYYSSLFHEMVHSTGHESRLARPGITDRGSFGDHRYSEEELIAEMGSCFLAGHAGILDETIENSASYLAGWAKKIRESDERLIVRASSAAQKASDLILCKSSA